MDNTQKSFRQRLGAVVAGSTPSLEASVPSTPPTTPGASLRAGDWQSPSNIRPIVAQPVATPPVSPVAAPTLPTATDAPKTLMQSLRGTGKKVLDFGIKAADSPLGRVATGGMAVYNGKSAIDDMSERGVNLNNSSDLATAGGTLAGLASAPVATGALAFGTGKFVGGKTVDTVIPFAEKHGVLPDGTTMGIARASDSIMHPVQTMRRMRDGGNFLADDPSKSNLLGPETLKLMAKQDASKSAPVQGGSLGGYDLRDTLRGQSAARGGQEQEQPQSQAPAPTLRQSNPVVIGKDGMATDGFNPVAGYGSFTNSEGKTTYFKPEAGGGQQPQGSLRSAYAPTQYSSRSGTSALDAQNAKLDSMGQSLRVGQPSFLNELRGNMATKRAARAYEVDSMNGLRQQEINNSRSAAEDMRATSRENNANTLRTSIYNHDASLRMTKAQMDIARMNHQDTLRQQGIENNRADRTLDSAEDTAGKTQLQSELETRNPGGDGKPDANRIASQRSAIERSMADLGLTHGQLNKSALAKEQLIAGAALIDRVNSHASNFNPFMADFMKTVKPHQLLNMKRLPNGDAQTPDMVGPDGHKTPGQVIPARFFTNKEANRFMPGTPTDEFSNLFAKETK